MAEAGAIPGLQLATAKQEIVASTPLATPLQRERETMVVARWDQPACTPQCDHRRISEPGDPVSDVERFCPRASEKGTPRVNH